MIPKSQVDSAGIGGKKDLTAGQVRTWNVNLRNRARVYFVLKSDSSTGSGFTTLALTTQAHGDCDTVALVPVTPVTAQTWNNGLVGGVHAQAFSDGVVKGAGYICGLVPPGVGQTTGSPIALAQGYPACVLTVTATVAGASTVTGSELIVFEEPEHAA
jgi:hypothetical protein